MQTETKDEIIVEGTFGRMLEIEDFLPRPEDLGFRPKGVKVTITLSEDSVAYFKEQGERLHTPYQRMIRNLIDLYVQQARPWRQDARGWLTLQIHRRAHRRVHRARVGAGHTYRIQSAAWGCWPRASIYSSDWWRK